MFRLLSITGACLALAVAAGCGGDDSSGSSASSSGASTGAQSSSGSTQSAASSSSGSGGKTITVKMENFAFTPATINAKVGQTIKWVNEDNAPHNATAQGGSSDLATKTFNKGGSDTFKLAKAGTIEYICTVHPNMHGTIVVTQ